MVMAQSLFIALRQRYPACEIDVVAPQWSLPLLERMPEVRRGIALSVGHGELGMQKRLKLGRELAVSGYTHAIVMPRSWKSALIPFFARVPVRTGYKGELRYGLINDIRELDNAGLKQVAQRYVAHAYPADLANAPPAEVPYPALSVDRANAVKLISGLHLNLRKPIVGFMPGAEYGPAKQWPKDNFVQLGKSLVERQYQIWIFGSEKERALGESIVEGIGGDAFNLCGKTRLVDVVDLVACAEHVVSNDSGLMHIASAVDVKVNVIYGSSTPEYTPPLTHSASIFYQRLPCSPCFARTCRYGHYNCLRKISPEGPLQSITNRN